MSCNDETFEIDWSLFDANRRIVMEKPRRFKKRTIRSTNSFNSTNKCNSDNEESEVTFPERHRKRSNTIDISALLAFRFTVSGNFLELPLA